MRAFYDLIFLIWLIKVSKMVYILAFFSKLSKMKSELPDLYSIHWLSILTTNLKARAQSVAYLAKNPFRPSEARLSHPENLGAS